MWRVVKTAFLFILSGLLLSGCWMQEIYRFDPATLSVTVVNQTGRQVKAVQVTVKAFDSRGYKMGEGVGFAYNLAPGQEVNVLIGQFYNSNGFVMQGVPARYECIVDWDPPILEKKTSCDNHHQRQAGQPPACSFALEKVFACSHPPQAPMHYSKVTD